MKALIDSGSEINIMPRRTYDRLGDFPIDTDIKWSLRTMDMNSDCRVIGVCHRIKVCLGGADVVVPVFVVEDSNSDLMLGRPWERQARAESENRSDGSLWMTIKSWDGRRIVKFCAVKAEHERNRSYARPAEEGTIDLLSGKV